MSFEWGMSFIREVRSDIEREAVRLLREFGGAAEIVASVAACGVHDVREAVRSLYGFDAMAAKTREVYSSFML